MKRSLCYLLPIILLLLLFSACTSTYPKEKIIPSIVKMCQEEYGLKVIAKMAENTVGVYIALDNLLDQNLSVSQEAIEKIGNAMLVVQRVVLSTNYNIEFYSLTVVDKKLPSIEFNLSGYIKDIKRAYTLDISRGEYHQRIARDLKLNLSSLVTADNFSVKPIKLADFLAEQIVGRLKANFEEDKTLKVNKIYGEFKEGEFLFSLDISPKEKNKEILKESLTLIDFVLRRYDFQDFKKVELKNLAGEEILQIRREDLPKIRRNKKLVDNFIS